MSYSPTAPTYVSRLDPQFRRFVNVVYHESPTSSMNDLSEGTTESLKSGSFSEKSPEFIAVDAYVDDGSSRIQGQREVLNFIWSTLMFLAAVAKRHLRVMTRKLPNHGGKVQVFPVTPNNATTEIEFQAIFLQKIRCF